MDLSPNGVILSPVHNELSSAFVEEMFTKPQFNNWIEIAVFGVNQQVSEEYIDAIAANGFPCGVQHAYNQLGLEFPFHEFRIEYKTGGMPIIIRLQDVPHTWEGLGNALYSVQTAADTGEPIVRTMEYEFPDQGFNRRMPQYMLGPEYLVAPVTNEDDSAIL